jgi:hypothetical protein
MNSKNENLENVERNQELAKCDQVQKDGRGDFN